MKFDDVKGLSGEEMKRKLIELRKELFEARMKNSLGQLANPVGVRGIKRDIARIMTAMAQKQG